VLERCGQSRCAADGRFVYAVVTTGIYCRLVLPEAQAAAGEGPHLPD
jgi:methylphosphotriester-DNA--protein-cysteine methyltransferase